LEIPKDCVYLAHEAKVLLDYFAFNQSYLSKGKIASLVLLPHEAK